MADTEMHFSNKESRSIYIGQNIDPADGQRICRMIHEIAIETDKPIYLWINCYGGITSESLAIIDTMRAVPNKTIAIGQGAVHSMAVAIFASADKRLLMPKTYLMLHEFWTKFDDKVTHTKIVEGMEKAKRLMDWFAEVLAESSKNKDPAFWREQMVPTSNYLFPEDALRLGLADEVLTDLSTILGDIKS